MTIQKYLRDSPNVIIGIKHSKDSSKTVWRPIGLWKFSNAKTQKDLFKSSVYLLLLALTKDKE